MDSNVSSYWSWKAITTLLIILSGLALAIANNKIADQRALIEEQQEFLEEQSSQSSELSRRADRQIARIDSLHQEVVLLKHKADSLCSFNPTAD